jgi:hypothetical protein
MDLDEIIERAAAAAAKAPKHLQEAAFKSAFDHLSRGPREDDGDDDEPRGRQRASRKAASRTPSTNAGSAVADLASRFDRTKLPDVTADTAILDRSLAVLRLVRDEYEVDGMTAPQIADILTSNMRIGTRRQHVSRALDKATRLVARQRDGRSVIYRIMDAGEDFLDAGGSDANERPTPRKTARKSRSASKRSSSAKASTTQAEKPRSNDAPTKTTRSGRRASGRPGPKAALEGLIEAGFFTEERGLAEMQDQLARARGYRYKPTDLSPALVRLLREGKLQRDRDDKGQYKYRAT